MGDQGETVVFMIDEIGKVGRVTRNNILSRTTVLETSPYTRVCK